MPKPSPEMQEILDRVKELDLAPWETMPPAQARAESVVRNAYWNEDPHPIAEVREEAIPGPHGRMRVRIYDPEPDDRAGPGLLYLHGGGWVICSLDTHDGVCRRLADFGRLKVVSLDYRMAPEFPFPGPLDDCVAAARWLREHARAFRIDPQRLAIGGDSAGANLALATLLVLRDAGESVFRGGALIYGVYADDHTTRSHKLWGGGEFILSTATMAWFWNQYVPDPAQRRDPRAAPLHADLRGLPPLFVSAAELDPLYDDSEQLKAKLAEAGVETTYHVWPGVTHACIMFSRMLPDADRQLQQVAGWVRGRLTSS